MLAFECWWPRRHEAVDVAAREQLRNRAALRGILDFYFLRQVEADLLRTARRLDAAAHPGHVRGFHPVIVLEDRTRPHVGGELIFRQPDLAALQIRWRTHAVGA